MSTTRIFFRSYTTFLYHDTTTDTTTETTQINRCGTINQYTYARHFSIPIFDSESKIGPIETEIWARNENTIGKIPTLIVVVHVSNSESFQTFNQIQFITTSYGYLRCYGSTTFQPVIIRESKESLDNVKLELKLVDFNDEMGALYVNIKECKLIITIND